MSVVSKRALVWIARIAFVGRGLVFWRCSERCALVGGDRNTHPVGTSGAMNIVLSEPAGRALALAVAIGLFSFAALRIIEAVDEMVYGYGGDLGGIAQRASLGFSGLFYTALGIAAASIVLGGGYAPDNEAQVRDWTAWALSAPLGECWSGRGVVVACIGIGLAVAGFGGRFKTRLMQWKEGSRFVMLLGAGSALSRARSSSR